MEKTKILLVSPMEDGQSGVFIHDTLIEMGNTLAFFDWRVMTKKNGIIGMNNELIKAVELLKPDLTIIVKGMGIYADTIDRIREIHNHHIVGWIFDCTIGGKEIEEIDKYLEFIKTLDIFYTFDQHNVDKLYKLGVNTKLLPQANYHNMYYPDVVNSIQKRKWGADVVFIGNVGGIHPNRDKLLERIYSEGFDLKLYGEVLFPENTEPDYVKDCHTGYAVAGDHHNKVVACSKIILGIDGWPDRERSWSLRLYKTMGAGGFYLTTHTKGIEEVFELVKHLDTYKDENEMIEKIIKYLNDDKLRESIAEQGKAEIDKNHRQEQRLQIILDDWKNRNI